MKVSMIDTVHKKTAFLNQVKAELELGNVTVYTKRVEQLEVKTKFDVITSRAFADLSDFVNWSGHLLARGRAIYSPERDGAGRGAGAAARAMESAEIRAFGGAQAGRRAPPGIHPGRKSKTIYTI
jgi:16S rRNA G527 N7-methylase RsmG